MDYTGANESEDAELAARVALAKKTVDALIARLPDELRMEAERLGYDLRRRCRDVNGETTMGDYGGVGLITLYLDTIKEVALEQGRDFATEVETTYLHEFGHHLGYGEDELRRRAL